MGENKRKDVRGIRKEEKERKRKKKRMGRKQEKKKEYRIEEREKRERKTKREIFSTFCRSKLDGPRRKVDPHIKSYLWVPKSWSFVKLHKVGNFFTWIIFSLKVI